MKNDLASSPVLKFLVVVLYIIVTAAAFAFSLYLLVYGTHDIYTYLIAVLFLILTSISGFFNIFTSYAYYRSSLYYRYLKSIDDSTRPLENYPTVAVAMPVYNENPVIVEKNLSRLQELNYAKGRITFYLLDDSTDAATRRRLKAFSESHRIRYIHRKDREGYKAGALNNMLRHCKEEFIAIFDYDEYITNRNFLMDLLPYFQDPSVSFVQTEKRYFKGNLFSDTVDLFDAYFFKFIQPSRAMNNTAVFAGSCGIIRRSALRNIGGFPEYIIEDTFFSLESDIHKYKGLYIPKVYALGKPMTTFTELAKQQWRYNYGDTQFLFYFLRKKNLSMPGKSKVDYVVHGLGLNYISTVLIMFTLVSVLIVFSSFAISRLSIAQLVEASSLNFWIEVFGVSTFVLSICTPIVMTKIHFKSVTKGVMVFLLNFALSFVRFKAAIAAALNHMPFLAWTADTGENSTKKAASAFRKSTHEVIFSGALLALSLVALLVNNIFGALWLLWYGVLYISAFFFFYKYG
ncbi:MAG: glycosyltransferase [Candidatus Micrarchaeota archaeon]|nr:glycosyltransferase [Candidatus Micrarchaeota archaeon]